MDLKLLSKSDSLQIKTNSQTIKVLVRYAVNNIQELNQKYKKSQ